MKKLKKSKWESIKSFYELYTSGLSRSEIEQLLKWESIDVLSYYKRGAVLDKEQKAYEKFPGKHLQLIKDIFLSFVMKLTPARRLFYGIAILLFVFAMVISHWLYAFLAFLLLNLLLAFELADKMVAKDELEIAREIQLSLQPGKKDKIKGLDITAFYHPAKEVGGDYYDFIKINDRKLAIIVGDVSGKGMPAALYAVKLQTLMELFAKESTSPKEMLVGINENLTQRMKKQYFITAVIAVFDLENNVLLVARAGHHPPFYFNSLTRKAVWLNPKGIGIGLEQNPEFENKIIEKRISIHPGDVFLFYTDGVTEAVNKANVEFGEKRLGKILTENVHLDTAAIKEKLIYDLNGFVKKALFDDDATLVVVKMSN